MTSNMRLLALAAAGLFGFMANPQAMTLKAMPGVVEPRLRQSKRQLLRAGSYGVIRWGYLKRPPQTVAQNKRASIKSKNRAKHRAASRGK